MLKFKNFDRKFNFKKIEKICLKTVKLLKCDFNFNPLEPLKQINLKYQ